MFSLELDLVIAFVGIAMITYLAFCAGRTITKSRSESALPRNSILLFPCTVFFALLFGWKFQANLSWANAIPFAAVVLWSNLTPVLLAFAAGVACNTSSLKKSKRLVTVSLTSLAFFYLIAPLARPIVFPPTIAAGGKFNGHICLQSHESTCAPASAVTLLRMNGIDATEKEMVKACLTCEQGTEALGLYRGLQIAANGNSQTAKLAARDPESWQVSGQLPNVALVNFPRDEFGPINSTDQASPVQSPFRFLGTGREDGHAVVVIGFERGNWIIADPAIGMVKWSPEELRSRFTGDAIYLSSSN